MNLKPNIIAIVLFSLFSFCSHLSVYGSEGHTAAWYAAHPVNRQTEKKIQFQDDALHLPASPRQTEKHSQLPMGARANTESKSPLEKLYTARFPQGHKKTKLAQGVRDRWETIIAPLLPIKLKPSKEFPHKKAVDSALWHPCNTRFTTLAGGEACIWNLQTDRGRLLKAKATAKGYELPRHYKTSYINISDERDRVDTIALNCDGTMLATSARRHIHLSGRELGYVMGIPAMEHRYEDIHDNIVRFWHVETGAELENVLTGEKNGIKVFWNPWKRTELAAPLNEDVFVYDIITKKIKSLVHSTQVASVSWAAEGNMLVAGTQQAAVVWDTAACTRKARLPFFQERFSANGIDSATDQDQQAPLLKKGTSIIAGNRDATLIAAVSGKDVRIWDAIKHKYILKFPHQDLVDSLAWSPAGGQHMTVAGNNVCLWDITTGEKKANLSHPQKVQLATYNNDGTQIATASADNNISVWDAQTGEQIYALPYRGKVKSVSWSNDNAQLATAYEDGTVSLWDTSHYKDLIDGNLTTEQVILMCADSCKQFRKKYPFYIPYPLSTFARHLGLKGVTTAELERVLSTLHPDVRDTFLAHYNISTEKQSLNAYDLSHQAFKIAQEMVPLGNQDDIKQALEGYIEEIPSAQENTMEDLVDETALYFHEKFREEAKNNVFAAIDANDPTALERNLNPVSINERDAQQNRTPLMHAIARYDSNNNNSRAIVERLLNYEGSLIFKGENQETREELRVADLAAVDWDNNTALMLAIEKNCFNVALCSAQKMDSDPSLHRMFAWQRESETTQESAYDIASKAKENNKQDPEYQALMTLLEKHKKSKYLPSSLPVDRQPQKNSALERMYRKRFLRGHAAQWHAMTEPLLPLPLQPTIKLDHAAKVKSALWINNDTQLITLSGNEDSYNGRKIDTVSFWNSTGKEYHTIAFPNTGSDQRYINAIACNDAGTKLALLVRDPEWFNLGSSHQPAWMILGWIYKVIIYSINPIAVIEDAYKVDNVHWQSDTKHDLVWQANAARPEHVRAERGKDVLPSSWHYVPMGFAGAAHNTLICDSATRRNIYALPIPHKVNIFAWNHDATRLATASNDNSVRVWDLKECNEFVSGWLTNKHVMALYTIADRYAEFRRKYPAYIPYSLRDCARHTQHFGITTAALAGALSALHPTVMNKFLEYYNVSIERQTPNIDGTPQQNRDSRTAFEQTRAVVIAGEENKEKAAAIEDVLEQYVVQGSPQEDYCSSFKAFDAARAMVTANESDAERASDVAEVLAEYAVEADPQSNSATDAWDDLIIQAKAQQNVNFRRQATQKLFAAIERHDLKALNENLNPVSVGDKNPDHNNRTALMHAVWCCDPTKQEHDQIFKTLLNYQELLIRDSSDYEISKSDLAATDNDGNTAFALAIKRNCFDLAAQIVAKVDRDPSLPSVLKTYPGNHPFMKLISILTKHKKQK
jgi:WD40 repeat protein